MMAKKVFQLWIFSLILHMNWSILQWVLPAVFINDNRLSGNPSTINHVTIIQFRVSFIGIPALSSFIVNTKWNAENPNKFQFYFDFRRTQASNSITDRHFFICGGTDETKLTKDSLIRFSTKEFILSLSTIWRVMKPKSSTVIELLPLGVEWCEHEYTHEHWFFG